MGNPSDFCRSAREGDSVAKWNYPETIHLMKKTTSAKKPPVKDTRKRGGLPLRMPPGERAVFEKAMKFANHDKITTWIKVVLRAEAKRLLGNDCFDGIDDSEET